MNNKLLSYSLIGLQIILLILVSVVLVNLPKDIVRLSGTTNYDALDVADGYYVDGTAVIDGSGNLSLTGTRSATVAGATVLSGATTITGTANVSQGSTNGSSTIQIGNTGSGVGPGCLVLGNSAGTTSTPVYITAAGTTISATTTRPLICK